MPPPRITDALDRHAQERPRMLAVVDGSSAWSWSELREAVDAAAAGARAGGVAPGDRVALRAVDGAQALIAALAVLRLGAVHVPVDHALAEPEVAQLLDTLQASWRWEGAASAVLPLARWPLTPLPGRGIGDTLPGGGSAFIRCSSGTTGDAKGVLLSHSTLMARIACANQGLGLGPQDRVLWLLPMAYHFAVSILLYLQTGSAVVFGNHLRAGVTAEIARRHEITFAYGSPYQVRRLAALPPGADLPRTLSSMVSTTTALDAGAAAAFHRRHGVRVRQALGIIEVGLPFVSPGDPGEMPGALGAPLCGFSARILPELATGKPGSADGEGSHRAGETLSAAQEETAESRPGELALRGPGLFDAYISPWRLRAEVVDDGWFRTGDRARCDDQGRVQLLGRLKDVINVGGVKVFPLEVESVLDAHPWVVGSRVRAGADSRLGEQVHAEVQLAPGVDPALAVPALGSWCSARLAALKRPALITVITQLPMTASGKVKR